MRSTTLLLILFSILFIQYKKGFSQCGNQKLIPEATLKTKNNYGATTSYSNGYLVVSEHLNDSLAYNAGVIHLYKKENQSWSPIKKLATQNTSSSQALGSDLICSDSVIIAKGNLYSSNEGANQILYIYRQNQSGNWPSVETERIVLEDTVNSNNRVGIFEMELNEKGELAIIYRNSQDYSSQVKIKIIDLVNENSILLDDTLSSADRNFYGYNTSIVFKSDVLFISNPDYTTKEGELQGAIFVFEKDGENEWNINPKAVLKASSSNQFGFGINMAYENDKLYVANSYDKSSMLSRLFIFDKPATGWTDMQESRYIEKSIGYTGSEVELTVKNDIIFWSIPVLEENFQLYMADNSVPTGYIEKEIVKPNDIGDEKMVFGTNPISTGDELIISTRHTYEEESNQENEHVLIYDLEPNSSADIEKYKYAFTGGFTSASDDEFGFQLSVSLNTLAIGAKGSANKWGDQAGSVYIYEKSNGQWDFQQQVIAPEEVNGDAFAGRIEISENLLFVGAPTYDSLIDGKNYYSTGKVYIYERQGNNWEYLTSLVSPDMKSENEQGLFGRNITYYNGYLAISEIKNDLYSTRAGGRVYLYQYNESSKEFHLHLQFENNENYNYDGFGKDVIINDKYMVIGTGNVSRSASRNLNVYVYKFNSEAFQNGLPDYRFASSYRDIFSRFGTSIAIKDDLLLVGDPNFKSKEDYESATGRVYGFRIPENSTDRSINYEDFHITPKETDDYSQFGSYLAINGNDLTIQAKDLRNEEIKNDHLYKFDLISITEDEFAYGNKMEMLDNPENNTKSGFGSAIELDNGFLILGNPEADTKSGFRSGSVFTTALQPALDSIPNLCNNTTEYELKVSPKGGILSLDQVVLENNILDIATLQAGEHTVSYNLNGCIEEKTFEIYPNTVLQSKADSIITKCTNDEAELYIALNRSQNMFAWYHKNEMEDDYQLLDSAMDFTRIQTTEPGFYKVSLLNSKCDEIEEEFQIINHEISPALNLSGELEYCESEAMISIENVDSYEELTWYFKEENSAIFQELDSANAQLIVNKSGEYFCTIGSLNCEFTTNTVSVFFKPNPQDLFVPNISTVDNDGYNDSFRIKTDYPFKEFIISIYDRYGKEVYQSYDQNFNWYAESGYSGTYYYLLKYETECGEIGQRKGWVQMMKD
ncbi:gliding motility-associated C-terminal domain-containing protein [Marivirga sericea]|uniref:Gliding motility-associated C-terminal domain-containing protein n=2 Tax=Marivirga sericea TaxID=1028 RepID=A0A1X7IIY4_9BACT|nr:gliding motility-associated C-terminal domain-containing protein [Marivirga sericea]SMG14253.1 gliding motility-associated C-terminal domain-containing protein [Marivirga sericea]